MPGVIMDQESRNGSLTNHDRDQRPNGVNGRPCASGAASEKGKARAEPHQNMTPTSPTAPDAPAGKEADNAQQENGSNGSNGSSRDSQAHADLLPQEIFHMTEGYVPLTLLLQRTAQKTYSDLVTTLRDLEQMPTPASALNGNASHTSVSEDMSQENLQKKLRLLNFATNAHEVLTKALVITGWSRKAHDVSKLVDLRIHLEAQKLLYTHAIETMATNQKALHTYRLPNPDLKTALEALTTGKASWMPDVSFPFTFM